MITTEKTDRPIAPAGTALQKLSPWLSGGGFSLRPLIEEDRERILAWRNSPAVRLQMVQSEAIDRPTHERWFEQQTTQAQSLHAQSLQLMAQKGERPVGVCNLMTLQGEALAEASTAEMGYYLGVDDVRGSLLAFVPALLTLNGAFEGLGLQQVQARVKASNLAAIRFNQTLGYTTVESGPLLKMVLSASDYRQASAGLQRLVRPTGNQAKAVNVNMKTKL